MLTIHFGCRQDEIKTLSAQIGRLTEDNPLTIYSQEDPWNVELDDRNYHMMMDTMTPMVHINMLANVFQQFLVPKSDPDGPNDGVMIMVTDKEIWTDEYVELRYP